MPAKNDGGAAFPVPPMNVTKGGDMYEPTPGMSLRDWFAGQALASMTRFLPDVWNEHDAGRIAYVIADAMIAERSK